METFAAGLRMILDKANAKVMDARAFELPLELLSRMAKALLTKEEAFDIFMSMLSDYYTNRRSAWEACKRSEEIKAFYSEVPKTEFGTDALAEAIGKTALQFLDDYDSLQSVDFPKYDTLKQIVFRINNIGAR